MISNFQDFGLSDNLILASDGEEVIDFIENNLEKLNIENRLRPYVQPVALLLLDINMPMMNGLETLKFVNRQYTNFNS